MSESHSCIGCGDPLCHLDDDPSGSRNATCARCRAEEEHDFDVEPGVTFSRSGERVRADIEPIASGK